LGARSSQGYASEPSSSEFSIATKNHKLTVSNYGDEIFDVQRKNEDDPSQGYEFYLHGSLNVHSIIEREPFEFLTNANQPPYSNQPAIWYQFNQHAGLTQELKEWGQHAVVFGLKLESQERKARIRDIFACDIFNCDEEKQNERILAAVNAFSVWQVGGTVITGEMTRTRTAVIDGELFWLGAIEASCFDRDGTYQVDLIIHKPNLQTLPGAPMNQTVQVGWSIVFGANGTIQYLLTHIPYIDFQPV
jgi:hypothetical protein